MLTVFPSNFDAEKFAWCIAGPEERRFSQASYETEKDAIDALWSEVTE